MTLMKKSTSLFALSKGITKDQKIKQASHFPTYYYQTNGDYMGDTYNKVPSTSSAT
jgi:hypothetical protein